MRRSGRGWACSLQLYRGTQYSTDMYTNRIVVAACKQGNFTIVNRLISILLYIQLSLPTTAFIVCADVVFTTTHKSKGLEFDTVKMVDDFLSSHDGNFGKPSLYSSTIIYT